MRIGTSRRTLYGSSVAAIIASLVLAPSSGNAQYTPVEGAHYSEMAGTGFQGSVNAVGGYAASVPLDLPAARGGLTVPVQVAYDGRKVGAAGLGWDVPLSF